MTTTRKQRGPTTLGAAKKRAAPLQKRGQRLADHAAMRAAVEREEFLRSVDDTIAEQYHNEADLLHASVADLLRRTWRDLQREKLSQLGRPADFESGVREAQLQDRLYRTAERAEAIGATNWGPYGRGAKHSLFMDVYKRSEAKRTGRPIPADVAKRLDEAATAMELRTGLGISSSLVAPAFFDIADFADIPRPDRVLADLVPTKPLPKGGSGRIPVFTASGAVGVTDQNTAPAEVDIVDSYALSTAAWLAGRFTVPLQMWEQMWRPEFDEAAAEILTGAYDATLETQLTIGSGSGDQLPGIVGVSGAATVTYTTGTPTAYGLVQSIGQAIGQVADGRDKLPDAILMRPARWAWIATSLDANDRPLVNVHGEPNPNKPGGSTPVGTIAGVNVYTSAAIPANLGGGTNQDEVIVTRAVDHRLYLSKPNVFAYPDSNGAGEMSVFVGLASSAVFIPSRYPSSTAIVTGTGLVIPSGF